ncbi:hypothetical protein J4429_05840 [Candidatus Pacearchaeota archaeon]|nr:hypothetical protein [Candidatus Pacearchaeota archaeon]
MLEKILELDCRKLAQKDPLEFRGNNIEERILRYICLAESYATNLIKEHITDARVIHIAGADSSFSKISAEGFEAVMSDENGRERTKINYDEKYIPLIFELNILYAVLNKLLEKPEKADNIDFEMLTASFRNNTSTLEIYGISNPQFVVFEYNGKRRKYKI